MKKYYIFGDSSGHWDPLARSLMEIGVDLETLTIPKDVIIIHVGDLIHKGPDSEVIVAFVTALMGKNNEAKDRGEWIQLIGNHESQYIKPFPVFWQPFIKDESINIINYWHKHGLMKLVYAPEFTNPNARPVLISHAGVATEFFSDFDYDLEDISHDKLQVFAKIMNEKFIKEPGRFKQAGVMLGYHGATRISPFWIETTNELTKKGCQNPSIDQIVGHTSPFMWDFARWYPSVPNDYIRQKYFSVNEENRLTIFHYAHSDARIFFTDPCFTERFTSTIPYQPYMILNENGEIESSMVKWKGHQFKKKRNRKKSVQTLSTEINSSEA